MKLLSISAKNYRALENIQISFPQEYCAISGHNNAGKSCVIRLVAILLGVDETRRWQMNNADLNYLDDYTQWKTPGEPIEIEYLIDLSKQDDSSLYSFIEKQAKITLSSSTVQMRVCILLGENKEREITISLDSAEVSDAEARKEIIRRLKGANALFLHNSTQNELPLFYHEGRYGFLHTLVLSQQDQREIQDIDKRRNDKVRKFAKNHRDELNDVLGKLSDKFDVEFSPMESLTGRAMPLRMNLKNKNVEVAMENWGSGTQNRTQILMSLLQASSIKKRNISEEKVTPIVVVEEPESFLHPSAQAEFGKVLQQLSVGLGIQVIVSTHSPFMLNQTNPDSNLLLRRDTVRGRMKGSVLYDTSNANWMQPFADQLGVCAPEFEPWANLFRGGGKPVVLVEGDTDRQYLEYLCSAFPEFKNDMNIDFVSYDGSGALNNTILLSFIMSKMEKCFITFDLDAIQQVEKSLIGLGLKKGEHYWPVGLNQGGKRCIEGLLPQRVVSAVLSRDSSLVMQSNSNQKDERTKAISELKKKYLEEFRSSVDYTKEELREFRQLWNVIVKAFTYRVRG